MFVSFLPVPQSLEQYWPSLLPYPIMHSIFSDYHSVIISIVLEFPFSTKSYLVSLSLTGIRASMCNTFIRNKLSRTRQTVGGTIEAKNYHRSR